MSGAFSEDTLIEQPAIELLAGLGWQTIPQLFVYNGLILVSNGVEGKMGSVTAAWEHYCDWKKISSEAEPGSEAE
jgi:type I site-specific restriction-modification system R (restriction) subunit